MVAPRAALQATQGCSDWPCIMLASAREQRRFQILRIRCHALSSLHQDSSGSMRQNICRAGAAGRVPAHRTPQLGLRAEGSRPGRCLPSQVPAAQVGLACEGCLLGQMSRLISKLAPSMSQNFGAPGVAVASRSSPVVTGEVCMAFEQLRALKEDFMNIQGRCA